MAAVERERQRVNLRMRRGLWILGTVGATAPFVGLFGTVVGIMNAFHDMAHTGQGGFAVVAAGISEALITTAAGIAVAVLAVVLFNVAQHPRAEADAAAPAPHRGVPGAGQGAAADAPGRRAGPGRRRGGLTVAMGGPSGGGHEGEGEGDGAIFADINITPLTDIFLVLLIIFMVTTTAITEAGADKGGFKVTLPKGGKGDAVAARDLSIAILADGRVVMGGKVVEEPELRVHAHRLGREEPRHAGADPGRRGRGPRPGGGGDGAGPPARAAAAGHRHPRRGAPSRGSPGRRSISPALPRPGDAAPGSTRPGGGARLMPMAPRSDWESCSSRRA